LDGLFDRPGTGVWAKIIVSSVNRTPVINHAWIGLTAELQVRVTFIVPEQDVVSGVLGFDEVIFEEQRLGL